MCFCIFVYKQAPQGFLSKRIRKSSLSLVKIILKGKGVFLTNSYILNYDHSIESTRKFFYLSSKFPIKCERTNLSQIDQDFLYGSLTSLELGLQETQASVRSSSSSYLNLNEKQTSTNFGKDSFPLIRCHVNSDNLYTFG